MVFSSSPIREKHIKWFCNFITVTYAILVLLDTHHVSPRNRIKTSLVTLISTCTAFLATAWREGMSPGVDRKSKAPPKSQFRKAWHGPLEELKRTTKASKHSLRNCVRSPKLFISLFGRLPLFLSGGFIVRERETNKTGTSGPAKHIWTTGTLDVTLFNAPKVILLSG